MTEDESSLSMIDYNLHREKISFSEKAFAYKMKYDVLKNQEEKGQIDHKTKKKSKEQLLKAVDYVQAVLSLSQTQRIKKLGKEKRRKYY